MKIICECGNELNLLSEKLCDANLYEEDKGIYTRADISKFEFWEQHDEVGIVCVKCKKAIWMFV